MRKAFSYTLSARGALALHGAVILLLFIPILAWSIFQSWEHTKALQEEQLRTLTRTLAQREYVMLEGARSFLRALSFTTVFTEATGPLDAEQHQTISDYFFQIKNNHLGIFSFLPNGSALCGFADGKPYATQPAQVVLEPYFHVLHDAAMHVGPPKTLRTGQQILPVSGSVRDNAGNVRCVFMLPLNIHDEKEYIDRITRTSSLPLQQSIILQDCSNTFWELAPASAIKIDAAVVSPLLNSGVKAATVGQDQEERQASWRDTTGTQQMGFMVSYTIYPDKISSCRPQSLHVLGITQPIPFWHFVFTHYHWQIISILGVLLLALLMAHYIGRRYFSAGLEQLAAAVNSSCEDIQCGHLGAMEKRTNALQGCREILALGKNYATMMRMLHDSTEQLRRLSTTDVLTGLLNRREFSLLAQKELLRAQRTGRPVSFAIMDLDLFKLVNDRYGHASGDIVLQTFAEVLRTNVRKNDVISRYGGEEFVLCLPETAKDGAMAALEKLRVLWMATDIPTDAGRINCTVSGGVYTVHLEGSIYISEESCGKLVETAIARADRALYQAKETGRNQIIFWTERYDA